MKTSLVAFFLVTLNAYAVSSQLPIQWSGDKTSWNEDKKIVHLNGNAKVTHGNREIKADKIVLNVETGNVEAEGHVVYTADKLTTNWGSK